MARFDINIDGIDRGFRVFGSTEGRIIHLLRDAIDDIADQIEEAAQQLAPEDKDPDAYSWRKRLEPELKHHPTDRDDDTSHAGRSVASSEITIARSPRYAIFVHEGTGPKIAKPGGKGMIYKSFGKWHKHDVVQGQEAQPYLFEAYQLINRTYVPERVSQLRAQIAGLKVASLPKGIKVVSVGRFGTRYQGTGGRFIKSPK